MLKNCQEKLCETVFRVFSFNYWPLSVVNSELFPSILGISNKYQVQWLFMSAYIHNISTLVPEHYYRQNFLRDKMKEYISNRSTSRRIIHKIYSNSGIDKRHTVIKDFRANGDPRFFFQKDGTFSEPTTGKRNALYTKYGKILFTQTAEKTLAESADICKEDITHVITVSCTGFFAPEPAFEIIKQLGLPAGTQRYHLGFMGCFAAFPAIKMARSFCESQPDAVVLIVCLELCSLHLQNSEVTDNLISASVFADGGAGLLISSRIPSASTSYFKLEQCSTSVAGNSEKDMAWTIGDTGFDMILSTYVPDIIETNMASAVKPLLEEYNLDTTSIDRWAIHPGGRAILDKIQKSMDLDDEQIAASRAVLAEFGNMSSATILFVLKNLLDKEIYPPGEKILGMAFGPGLTIETGLFLKLKS